MSDLSAPAHGGGAGGRGFLMGCLRAILSALDLLYVVNVLGRRFGRYGTDRHMTQVDRSHEDDASLRE